MPAFAYRGFGAVVKVYTLDDDGQLVEIELHPDDDDALDAWAFIESWTAHEAILGWLADAAEKARQDPQIRELVALRVAREAANAESTKGEKDAVE